MSLHVVNLYDLVDAMGGAAAEKILAAFSCPKNPEVEGFLRMQAIDFARRKLAVTYLLINEAGRVSAFFTLTHKALQIDSTVLSARLQKKIARYAVLDRVSGGFVLSAFLIAQFGRDFTERGITGAELMTACLNILRHIQRTIGGGIVYLECEDEEKLLQFYERDDIGFRHFGQRQSEEGVLYHQLLKTL